jgi:AbrB family looped-hinge helix DNA binding protein
MDIVTVSRRLQVLLPRAVRERFRLNPGDKLQLITLGERIELVPLRPMRAMRGFLKGFNPIFARDENDRV